MSVTLNKGGNVSLSKVAPNLRQIAVGLGWDARATSGADFDLDASALMVGANGKILSDSHFVFFNNLRSLDGSERVHPNREPGGRRGDRPLRLVRGGFHGDRDGVRRVVPARAPGPRSQCRRRPGRGSTESPRR